MSVLDSKHPVTFNGMKAARRGMFSKSEIFPSLLENSKGITSVFDRHNPLVLEMPSRNLASDINDDKAGSQDNIEGKICIKELSTNEVASRISFKSKIRLACNTAGTRNKQLEASGDTVTNPKNVLDRLNQAKRSHSFSFSRLNKHDENDKEDANLVKRSDRQNEITNH